MRRVELRLGCQELIAGLRIRAGGNLARGQSEELVVDELRRCGRGPIPHREPGPGSVVEDGIAADHEVRAGVEAPFLSISDDGRVMRVRPLLDYVVLDQRIAAIRQVDAVARGA